MSKDKFDFIEVEKDILIGDIIISEGIYITKDICYSEDDKTWKGFDLYHIDSNGHIDLLFYSDKKMSGLIEMVSEDDIFYFIYVEKGKIIDVYQDTPFYNLPEIRQKNYSVYFS